MKLRPDEFYSYFDFGSGETITFLTVVLTGGGCPISIFLSQTPNIMITGVIFFFFYNCKLVDKIACEQY